MVHITVGLGSTTRFCRCQGWGEGGQEQETRSESRVLESVVRIMDNRSCCNGYVEGLRSGFLCLTVRSIVSFCWEPMYLSKAYPTAEFYCFAPERGFCLSCESVRRICPHSSRSIEKCKGPLSTPRCVPSRSNHGRLLHCTSRELFRALYPHGCFHPMLPAGRKNQTSLSSSAENFRTPGSFPSPPSPSSLPHIFSQHPYPSPRAHPRPFQRGPLPPKAPPPPLTATPPHRSRHSSPPLYPAVPPPY